MADNPQDKAQIIQMGSVVNTGSNGQVWFDGSHLWINVGGINCRIDHPTSSTWSVANVTTNRTYDGSTITSTQNNQILGTLISELKTNGYIA